MLSLSSCTKTAVTWFKLARWYRCTGNKILSPTMYCLSPTTRPFELALRTKFSFSEEPFPLGPTQALPYPQRPSTVLRLCRDCPSHTRPPLVLGVLILLTASLLATVVTKYAAATRTICTPRTINVGILCW